MKFFFLFDARILGYAAIIVGFLLVAFFEEIIQHWFITLVIIYGCYAYNKGIGGTNLFAGSPYLSQFLRSIFEIKIVSPVPQMRHRKNI